MKEWLEVILVYFHVKVKMEPHVIFVTMHQFVNLILQLEEICILFLNDKSDEEVIKLMEKEVKK